MACVKNVNNNVLLVTEITLADFISEKTEEMKQFVTESIEGLRDVLLTAIAKVVVRLDYVETQIKSIRKHEKITESSLPSCFPIQSVDQLNELESSLKANETFAKMLEQLKRINGAGQKYSVACRTLCDFMFTR